VYRSLCSADPALLSFLAAELGVSVTTAAVLYNRHMDCVEDAKAFLDCGEELRNDPFLMYGMYEATDLINEAVESGQKITIYGDYDVDGVSSVAMLYRCLRSSNANVSYYIPDRNKEGYGLNKNAVASLAESGTELLITVDCGITSLEEVSIAKEMGMDVIVTDHHTPLEILPDADVVLNPKQKYCIYPFKDLCGAGIVMKLIEALVGEEEASKYYDILALATVADVVSLSGENRFYVRKGLEKINKQPVQGIASLKLEAYKVEKSVDSYGIAFILAPRINSAGRMDSAITALRLLISDDRKETDALAHRLCECNDFRKQVEADILSDLSKQLDSRNLTKEKIIVVSGERWHKGVIGIVASRITDKFYRPSIVMSLMGDTYVASARSIQGFNIFNALNPCSSLFDRFGGHAQAAGFSLKKDKYDEFIRKINEYAENNLSEEIMVSYDDYECPVSVSSVDYFLAKELEGLEPYGEDNSPPVFLSENVSLTNLAVIGKDKSTIRSVMEHGISGVDCISFGQIDSFERYNIDVHKDVLYSIELNKRQGVEKVQANVHKISLRIVNDADIDAIKKYMLTVTPELIRTGVIGSDDTAKGTLSGKDIVEKISESVKGTLVAVTGIDSVIDVLSGLYKKGVLKKFEIYLSELPKKRKWGENCILISPGAHTVPVNEFNSIYLGNKVNNTVFTCNEGVSSDIIYYNEGENKILSEKYTREDFARFYVFLKNIAPKLIGWFSQKDFYDTIFKLHGMYYKDEKSPIDEFSVTLMLDVFYELGFIKKDKADGMIKIEILSNVNKKSLAESVLYSAYMNLSK